MIGYGNSVFLRRSTGPGIPPVDPDAQAFITAAAITDPTQQAAINTLVVDLKGYNVWTKMKALYPIVGDTASQQKYNLKDPRDLDAAFRLQFLGGWTHSVNGALPNGTNAYADTFLNPSVNLISGNNHIGYYSRTDASTNSIEIGTGNASGLLSPHLRIRLNGFFGFTNTLMYVSGDSLSQNQTNSTNTNSTGHYIGNILAFNNRKTYKNGNISGLNTLNYANELNNANISLAAYNQNGTNFLYTTKECAFASIGDGLTDTEAANFYTAVQAFQTTLGRSIGTQTVSDADAQAFVTNAGIVDQVEANAINNLVIGMKADGLWTKMQAVYPFVGGTASTHKFNLKNPLDTDAAFRLVFSGGWTHSSSGALPNGTNAFANTFLNPSTSLGLNSTHLSYYSRTNFVGSQIEIGSRNSTGTQSCYLTYNFSNIAYAAIHKADGIRPNIATDTRGFYVGSRILSTQEKYYTTNIAQTLSGDSVGLNNFNIYLGCYNANLTPMFYSSKQTAFASIGDGLTDTEAANFYTRVQNFNTALARQV